MNNSLSQKITNISARINQLKTIGLKSSSSLGLYSKVVQVPDNVETVKIVLSAEEPFLFSSYLETPTNLSDSAEAFYAFRNITDENNRSIVLIERDNPFTNGVSVRIVGTSYFTTKIEQG